jgi:hypothetical protein
MQDVMEQWGIKVDPDAPDDAETQPGVRGGKDEVEDEGVVVASHTQEDAPDHTGPIVDEVSEVTGSLALTTVKEDEQVLNPPQGDDRGVKPAQSVGGTEKQASRRQGQGQGQGKVSLVDRIDWDRQTGVGAGTNPSRSQSHNPNNAHNAHNVRSPASSGSWRSDERDHSINTHGGSFGAGRGGRGGFATGGRGSHSRQPSHDTRKRPQPVLPAELLNTTTTLPETPTTPGSTTIVTPTTSVVEDERAGSDHRDGRDQSRQQDSNPNPSTASSSTADNSRRARTERPRLALQDSTFKRMTKGLLGGQGGGGRGGAAGTNDRTWTRAEPGPAPPPTQPREEPAIATPTGIAQELGGNEDGWDVVKPKGRSQRGKKRNV